MSNLRKKIADGVRPGGPVELIKEKDIRGMDAEIQKALESVNFCLDVLKLNSDNPAYDKEKQTLINIKNELASLDFLKFC